MAGMYIHIPFCKKICSYCDFYKTTQDNYIPVYLEALDKELTDRRAYLEGESLETIYIGGGTPSLINASQLKFLFNEIGRYYPISPDCEITLEANPDDLTVSYLRSLKVQTPVNRLSIGIQSFDNKDLRILRRRHTAHRAVQCLQDARDAGFDNITIDLMYGLPGMTTASWERNLTLAFMHHIPHLSAYHLTLEPGTALSGMAKNGLVHFPGDDESTAQFMLLHDLARDNGFIHYEISNLALDGFMSRHNSNYWLQKKYIGLGPSAHSYNLVSRRWNTRNLKNYMKAVNTGDPYAESEILDIRARFNEYLMLSLRTHWGVNTSVMNLQFGKEMVTFFENGVNQKISPEWVIRQDNSVRLTPGGWMVSDYIIGQLMAEPTSA